MPHKPVNLIIAVVSIMSLLLFASIHLWAAVAAMAGGGMPDWLKSAFVLHAAGLLTGLVVGIVASTLGVQSPDAGVHTRRMGRLARTIGLDAERGSGNGAIVAARLYVIVFLVTGAVAGVATATSSARVLPYTDSLALLFLGLLIAATRSGIGQPTRA